jgi:tyrosine-specific transport protein
MHKKLSAIFLVAGTCIGSGMFALPIVLASLGIIPSIILMLVTWFFMYYTALINVELNLRAGEGLPLGKLARKFSGPVAELIGTLSFKILSYALLAVFIYGGTSIFQKMMTSSGFMEDCNFTCMATGLSLIAAVILLLPTNILGHINSLLFAMLILIIAFLVTGLFFLSDIKELPLFSNPYQKLSIWAALLPVVFTSFGFQVIFHTLTNLCHKDRRLLKTVFFWGSLIPALVYIIWTTGVLVVVSHGNPEFYDQMTSGQVEVGDLIEQLSEIAKWPLVQVLVWWISLLAIATSVLGVGVGLYDSFKKMFSKRLGGRIVSAAVTILPAYFVAVWVPNAFIAALGFAGMILAIIAILLPIYLFYRTNDHQLNYPELRYHVLILLSFSFGVMIIVSELFNMFHK